jgi:predicted AlkP superfamily pyrophosphatase or phosphodiesterase
MIKQIILVLLVGFCRALPLKQTRAPTLMISLDGFRADKLNQFLQENPNSNFQKRVVEVGVKADYMIPSFPSLTFPNHFTLVTGLYMEVSKNMNQNQIEFNFEM